MNIRYLLDGCALFAFFRINNIDSGSKNFKSKLIISDDLKKIFFKMLINQIDIRIPIPSLSEFMFKMFKMGKIKEFNDILTDFKSRKNISFLSWDFNVLQLMLNFLTLNSSSIHQYFKEKKKGLDLFDLSIYQIALLNNINNIVSKDEIFDEFYKLNRV